MEFAPRATQSPDRRVAPISPPQLSIYRDAHLPAPIIYEKDAHLPAPFFLSRLPGLGQLAVFDTEQNGLRIFAIDIDLCVVSDA